MVLYSDSTGTPDERPDMTFSVPEISLNFPNDELVSLNPKGSSSVVPAAPVQGGLQEFIYLGTHRIRVVLVDGKPMFVAADVCGVLGYRNAADAIAKHVRAGQKGSIAIRDGIPGNPNKIIITEGGLYRLIMRSDMPTADAFQDWVTDEVLPSIRKTGSYTMEKALPIPSTLELLDGWRKAELEKLAAVQRAEEMTEMAISANNQLTEAKEVITELEPKAAQIDYQATLPGEMNRQALARSVQAFVQKERGVRVLHEEIYKFLIRKGILIADGRSDSRTATAHAIKMGYARNIGRPGTDERMHETCYFTAKGASAVKAQVIKHVKDHGHLRFA